MWRRRVRRDSRRNLLILDVTRVKHGIVWGSANPYPVEGRITGARAYDLP